jgi:predicted dinucleotide-binding enzyme
VDHDPWLQATGPAASAGTFADAARFGDVVILSVRGSAAENVLESARDLEHNGDTRYLGFQARGAAAIG